jgi:hypothetical protein
VLVAYRLESPARLRLLTDRGVLHDRPVVRVNDPNLSVQLLSSLDFIAPQ